MLAVGCLATMSLNGLVAEVACGAKNVDVWFSISATEPAFRMPALSAACSFPLS